MDEEMAEREIFLQLPEGTYHAVCVMAAQQQKTIHQVIIDLIDNAPMIGPKGDKP